MFTQMEYFNIMNLFNYNFISCGHKFNIIELTKEILENVNSALDTEIPTELSDSQILLHLADRVERMLKGDPDLLMSYLYRLDVEEKKIASALKTSITPVHITFANLIWERQKQRIITKKKYKQDPIEGWEF